MHLPTDVVAARPWHTQAIAKLVGRTPAFLDAIAPIPTLARSDVPVLVTGETGTGKELVARALHYLGTRADRAFSPVNCGALPDALLEDELFGHEPGAFTDARARREGLLAESHGGTIFLDEADSLTPRCQVALLRLLQDGLFRPLGSCRQMQAEVRFLAASNVPLDRLVTEGRFRADLYYRLSVITVHLPPLRERREDIPVLAAHFIEKHTPPDRTPARLSGEAQRALLASDWPGNVRQLENVIQRAILLVGGATIEPRDLGLAAPPEGAGAAEHAPAAGDSYRLRKQRATAEFERQYLAQLMRRHQGNVTQAAGAAGMDRRDLGRLLKKNQLHRAAFQTTGPIVAQGPHPHPSRD